MNLARRLGASYAALPKAAVVMAAGSTGHGTADRYSDLELDVYWHAPPTDDERRQGRPPPRRVGWPARLLKALR